MKFAEKKYEFLQLWGTLGSQWGINRTMAQIHALLLISPKSLSAEEIMNELHISRGNANMNLRELITWNLIYKEIRKGERKEFFRAEKDIWEVAIRVVQERRKRELLPVISKLSDLTSGINTSTSEEELEFKNVIGEIGNLVNKLDTLADSIIKADKNWFFSKILKLFK